ncbi:MAG TPA: hypothetical protein PKK26_03075, partial [Candidatus Wallbacteria bacterium]|nr:hypothetical protein [Candidatus Wallbacteria bacterium]
MKYYEFYRNNIIKLLLILVFLVIFLDYTSSEALAWARPYGVAPTGSPTSFNWNICPIINQQDYNGASIGWGWSGCNSWNMAINTAGTYVFWYFYGGGTTSFYHGTSPNSFVCTWNGLGWGWYLIYWYNYLGQGAYYWKTTPSPDTGERKFYVDNQPPYFIGSISPANGYSVCSGGTVNFVFNCNDAVTGIDNNSSMSYLVIQTSAGGAVATYAIPNVTGGGNTI